MIVRTPQTKLEVLIDSPLRRRLQDLLEEAGTQGYVMLPTMGGFGDQGRWRDEQVTGGSGSKVLVVIVVEQETADRIVDLLQPLIDEYGLVVSASQVDSLQSSSAT